jgi:hypothetical protein
MTLRDEEVYQLVHAADSLALEVTTLREQLAAATKRLQEALDTIVELNKYIDALTAEPGATNDS